MQKKLLKRDADYVPLHEASYSNFKSQSGLNVSLANHFSFWSLPATMAVFLNQMAVACQSSDFTCTLLSGDYFIISTLFYCMLFKITCEAYPSLTHQSWKTTMQSLQGPLKLWKSFLVLEMRDNGICDEIFFFLRQWPYWLLPLCTPDGEIKSIRNGFLSS